jgi:hypothetical protein
MSEWKDLTQWLSKVDQVLDEHEQTTKQAASLVPESTRDVVSAHPSSPRPKPNG